MADLFETDLEAALQPVDIISRRLGHFQRLGIGHVDRAGEIIGEADAVKLARLIGRQVGAVAQRIERIAQFKRGEHDGHVE